MSCIDPDSPSWRSAKEASPAPAKSSTNSIEGDEGTFVLNCNKSSKSMRTGGARHCVSSRIIAQDSPAKHPICQQAQNCNCIRSQLVFAYHKKLVERCVDCSSSWSTHHSSTIWKDICVYVIYRYAICSMNPS